MAAVLGSAVSFSTAKEVFDRLANVDRKIAIRIKNKTGKEFIATENTVYFKSGTSDIPIPERLDDEAFVWGARKTAGPFLTGSVGMFTYHVDDKTKDTLAVMWNVPFDFNLYSSWWKVKMYKGPKHASKDLFKSMHDELESSCKKHEGDNAWHGPHDIDPEGFPMGYMVKGSMANSRAPTLEIHVMMKDEDAQ